MIRRDADSLLAFVALWKNKLTDGQWDAWTRMVRGFALKVDDPTVVDWLRQTAGRNYVDGVLDHIRILVTVGDLEQAEVTADRFEQRLQHVERLVHRRWIETGHRMLERDVKGGAPRKTDRDMELAREYQRRSQGPTRMSATNLKVEVGKAVGLGRSASIDAINRGLRMLDDQ